MMRNDVFENYEKAEKFEKILQANDIPILPALEFNGIKMQCINNQYFYLFNWVDGKVLFSEEIKKEHCKIMGEILAKIHNIEQISEPFLRKEININWDTYGFILGWI